VVRTDGREADEVLRRAMLGQIAPPSCVAVHNNMVLSRLELETYFYQKYTLPIKLKNQ
jgi:hypothetical protein